MPRALAWLMDTEQSLEPKSLGRSKRADIGVEMKPEHEHMIA